MLAATRTVVLFKVVALSVANDRATGSGVQGGRAGVKWWPCTLGTNRGRTRQAMAARVPAVHLADVGGLPSFIQKRNPGVLFTLYTVNRKSVLRP